MTNTNSAYVLTANSVSLLHNGKTYSAQKSHSNFDDIVAALNKRDYDTAANCINVGRGIANYLSNSVEFRDGGVFYKNNRIGGPLVQAVLDYKRAGSDYSNRLVKFMEKLFSNVSQRAIQESYTFLVHQQMPICENGDFLCYKGVRNDYYSITAGSMKLIKGKVDQYGHIFNGIGEEIECERNLVCDDKTVGCAGNSLHAGSFNYANDFKSDGRLMIVKVNPKDIVSVPEDAAYQKMRVCAYQVIGEESRELNNISDSDYVEKAIARDANGRFVKGSAVGAKRDSQGRFVSA